LISRRSFLVGLGSFPIQASFGAVDLFAQDPGTIAAVARIIAEAAAANSENAFRSDVRSALSEINSRLAAIEGRLDTIIAEIRMLPVKFRAEMDNFWRDRLFRLVAARGRDFSDLAAGVSHYPIRDSSMRGRFSQLGYDLKTSTYELMSYGTPAAYGVGYGAILALAALRLGREPAGTIASARRQFRNYLSDCRNDLLSLNSTNTQASTQLKNLFDREPKYGSLYSWRSQNYCFEQYFDVRSQTFDNFAQLPIIHVTSIEQGSANSRCGNARGWPQLPRQQHIGPPQDRYNAWFAEVNDWRTKSIEHRRIADQARRYADGISIILARI
jgi:hypothetical protein